MCGVWGFSLIQISAMTSRLDRLVTLLETGSTQLIRNTAAQQLADVQKQHPDELFNLLGRVIPYLHSRSWDTRTAAAKAIGGIVSNAEPFDPNADDDIKDGSAKYLEEDVPVKKEDQDGQLDDQLSLDTLDVNLILTYGKKLVASAGKEYEYALAGMDAATRLNHQKKSLTSRLGLGGEYMEDDLIDERDLAVQPRATLAKVDTSVARQNSLSSATPHSPFDNMGSAMDESGLSKRQLNQLKRKNKSMAKAGGNKMRVVDLSGRKASDVNQTAAPHAIKTMSDDETNGEVKTPDYFSLKSEPAEGDSAIVSEFKGPIAPEKPMIQTEAEEQGLEWPFERMSEFLMVDLFDPSWEIRHGAALGLREVIRVHGRGAGRVFGKTRAQNNLLNRKWLDDLACRLLCVLMLDRFGDYVSDTVVAPIRESVGQTLGALISQLPEQTALSTYHLLHLMIMQKNLDIKMPIWEVCHGGMIGLKYFVAVRSSLLLKRSYLVDGVLEAVTKGLSHHDDDVRSVGAATLVPIVKEVIEARPDLLNNLMNTVWDCLSDLTDDLSASTGAVMDLLAKLCTFPRVLDAMKANAAQNEEYSFGLLVPRLYPFLRHTITSVRSAVLRALLTFSELQGEGTDAWIGGRILRLVFQNIILERNEGVVHLSLHVWKKLVALMSAKGLANYQSELTQNIQPLVEISLHPIGLPRSPIPHNPTFFIRPSGNPYATVVVPALKQATSNGGEPPAKRRKKSEKKDEPPASAHNVDGHMLQGDVDLVGMETLIRSRICAAQALGLLLSSWDGAGLPELWGQILPRLSASASSTQLTTAMVLEEYAKTSGSSAYMKQLSQHLAAVVENDRPSWYSDIVAALQAARGQCHAMINAFRDHAHVPPNRLPIIAVVCQGDSEAGPNAFSLADAEKIVGPDFDRLIKSLNAAQRLTGTQFLKDAQHSALATVENAKIIKELRDLRVKAAAASALCAMREVPKKPGSVIKSMMDGVKTEENFELQQRSAVGVASLIDFYTSASKRGPVDKVLSNLVKFYCADTSETPEFHPNAHLEQIILSLRKEEDRKDHPDAAKFEREAKEARTMRRGAKEALEQLARLYGANLLVKIPMLKTSIERPLQQSFTSDLPTSIMDSDDSLGQEIVDGLSTLRALTPTFNKALQPWIISLLPMVTTALQCRLSVIRYAAAKCLATICSVITIEGMTILVEKVLPGISNTLDLPQRQGVVECIYHLIHVMEDAILPYVIFLIVPVLGRMSDSDNDVRLLATTAFATLVKLVPLEAGIPDPPGLSEELLKGRERERKFMAQMLDPKKVEAFEIPVAIKAELRSYQQDGVNWLAFLNRYHLHGILCDDMGLGKTLQTICIVASDHHMRAEEYAKTQAPDSRPLPSLIICPPTLSGHWQQELAQYAPFLTSVAYVGPPSERNRVRSQLATADIVITSYDICRNDNDAFAPMNWNYCVLDEGHLIKNAKAKITLAVKKLKSNHRLILSGTPIQNNVLELWSLFDFLMPGFLGTEKVFQDRFARPIAASRNAKSSSKEQEAGALAVEALHKQVLPFLLRRLKEEVLNDLPPKIIQNYYCELSDLQRRLFDDFFKNQKKSLQDNLGSSDKEAKQHIFAALQFMRKLCNSPALVVKENQHKQYDQITKQLANAHPPSTLRDIVHAPKLTALRDLLLDCGIGATSNDPTAQTSYVSPHRALIFCQVKEMLDMVANDVIAKLLPGVTYLRLDGSVEATRRQNIVNTFNTDPSYDCLLLTTSVGGLGLNLTGADTVIFVEHDWNPQKDIQAMDRAHRIGQKKVVNVYRLITRGTIEEKIMGLQRFKIDVASTVVNQQNAGLGTMGTDQLLDLFNLGETADVPDPGKGGAGGDVGGGTGDSVDDAVDAEGNIREKGKKGWLDDLGELSDQRQYDEDFNLEGFLKTMNR